MMTGTDMTEWKARLMDFWTKMAVLSTTYEISYDT